MQTVMVQAEVPVKLLAQIETLVNDGWFPDTNDLIVDALRRFLDTHRPALMEQYILKDVEWGLHGDE